MTFISYTEVVEQIVESWQRQLENADLEYQMKWLCQRWLYFLDIAWDMVNAVQYMS
jgi:hypothetical protein